MYFECSSQNVERLDRDRFDFITNFHDHLQGEEGMIEQDFKNYFPQLTLCKFDKVLDISPPILMAGSQSSTRMLFGNTWADALHDHAQTPDLFLEKHAAPGYQQAAAEGFACDQVETVIKIRDKSLVLNFVRYIAKLETCSGIRFFGLAGKVLDRTLQ